MHVISVNSLLVIEIWLVLLSYDVNAYTGTFWVVTDIHAADDYVSGTDPSTFCTQGTGVAGRLLGTLSVSSLISLRFGYFNCDSPPNDLIPNALSFMASIPADFVFWLGDSPTTYTGFIFWV